MREPAILLVAMTDRDSGFHCDKDSDSQGDNISDIYSDCQNESDTEIDFEKD